jgi:hypothetical protein
MHLQLQPQQLLLLLLLRLVAAPAAHPWVHSLLHEWLCFPQELP